MAPRTSIIGSLSHNWLPGGSGISQAGLSPGLRTYEYHRRLLDGGEEFANLRGLELFERLRLDLADALTSHRQVMADLLQGPSFIMTDSEAETNYRLFSRRENAEDPIQLCGHLGLVHMGIGGHRELIRDHLPELSISITDRRFQRHRLLKCLHGFMKALRSHAERVCNFFQASRTSELLPKEA
jgi:hypothetical protein